MQHQSTSIQRTLLYHHHFTVPFFCATMTNVRATCGGCAFRAINPAARFLLFINSMIQYLWPINSAVERTKESYLLARLSASSLAIVTSNNCADSLWMPPVSGSPWLRKRELSPRPSRIGSIISDAPPKNSKQ